MTEREYIVTVTQDFSKLHYVTAPSAHAARRIIERLTHNEDVGHLISQSEPGSVGPEIIRMVEPVVNGPQGALRLRQCLGHVQTGRRCARQAMATADGYYCAQHLWQDGVEEGSR